MRHFPKLKIVLVEIIKIFVKNLNSKEMQLAKDLGFDYIISMAHPDNIASCKTLEKIGLEFVKETKLSNGFLRRLYMKKLN